MMPGDVPLHGAPRRPADACGQGCGCSEATRSDPVHQRSAWAVSIARGGGLETVAGFLKAAAVAFFQPDANGWAPPRTHPVSRNFELARAMATDTGITSLLQGLLRSTSRRVTGGVGALAASRSDAPPGVLLSEEPPQPAPAPSPGPTPSPAPGPSPDGNAGDELDLEAHPWLDGSAYDGVPRQCCCPLNLKILGNGPPVATGVPGEVRTFFLRPDAPGRPSDAVGHSFRVQLVSAKRPYGDNEDCKLIFKEISDKALAGWEKVNGESKQYDLPTEEWHDMKELNPWSAVFDEWNRVFGAPSEKGYDPIAAQPGAARKNPSGPGNVLDLPDDPSYSSAKSRDVEAEITVLSGCHDCLPITVRFRQKIAARQGKNVWNFFTYTGDPADATDASSAFAASTNDNLFNRFAYAAWKHAVQKEWKKGKDAQAIR